MATKKYIQTSLNAGELSERMAGRVDFQKYFSGLSTMVNFIPLKQGEQKNARLGVCSRS